MLGTIVNTVAIVSRGLLGFYLDKLYRKNEKNSHSGDRSSCLLIGGSMALQTKNPLIVIASLVLGGVIGEWIDIELRLQHFGQWLESKLAKNGK